MGAIVKVRNVKLGDGMPKICIPVTDTNLDDLKKSDPEYSVRPDRMACGLLHRYGRSRSPDQGNDLIPECFRKYSGALHDPYQSGRRNDGDRYGDLHEDDPRRDRQRSY